MRQLAQGFSLIDRAQSLLLSDVTGRTPGQKFPSIALPVSLSLPFSQSKMHPGSGREQRTHAVLAWPVRWFPFSDVGKMGDRIDQFQPQDLKVRVSIPRKSIRRPSTPAWCRKHADLVQREMRSKQVARLRTQWRMAGGRDPVQSSIQVTGSYIVACGWPSVYSLRHRYGARHNKLGRADKLAVKRN